MNAIDQLTCPPKPGPVCELVFGWIEEGDLDGSEAIYISTDHLEIA